MQPRYLHSYSAVSRVAGRSRRSRPLLLLASWTQAIATFTLNRLGRNSRSSSTVDSGRTRSQEREPGDRPALLGHKILRIFNQR